MINPDIFSSRAILTPQDEVVNAINREIVNQFLGELVTYKRFDSAVDDPMCPYPLEFLNTLLAIDIVPHVLLLKKSCPVILLHYLNPSSGCCNLSLIHI